MADLMWGGVPFTIPSVTAMKYISGAVQVKREKTFPLEDTTMPDKRWRESWLATRCRGETWWTAMSITTGSPGSTAVSLNKADGRETSDSQQTWGRPGLVPA